MGTISKKFYVPTDAKVTITNTFYYDLEDADCENAYEKAREIVVEDEAGTPTDETKARLQERGLDDVLVEYAQDDKNDTHVTDFDEVNVVVDWNWRWIDVCEWCESANCDGDDCASEPARCDWCQEHDDNCECTFCEHCGEYIDEDSVCECSSAVKERTLNEMKDVQQSTIYVTDLPIYESAEEVEGIL